MKLDKTDIKILQILQTDGRITNRQLSEQVALSASACLERTKRLEQSGFIRFYQAHIALDKIANVSTALVEVTLNSHKSDDFVHFENKIAAIPEIVDCWAVGGGIDYVLKIVAPNIETYQTLMDDLLDQNIGIDKYFTYFVTKHIKAEAGYPLSTLCKTTQN